MKIGVLGGDLRFVQLIKLLKEDGHEVFSYGLEKVNSEEKKCIEIDEFLKNVEIVIGGIPFIAEEKFINFKFSDNKFEIEELFKKMKNKVLIAGPMSDKIMELAEDFEVNTIDIMQREELAVLNAISTAEGTIQIAMEETDITIHNSKVLILGFGRIGKILANILKSMGAKVSCEARKLSDLAWIKAYNYEPIKIDEYVNRLREFDIIINTIPVMMLDEKELKEVRKDAIVIDVASKPGGVNQKVAQQEKIKSIWALALPGKVAAKTSAEYIKETIYNIVEENLN